MYGNMLLIFVCGDCFYQRKYSSALGFLFVALTEENETVNFESFK